MAWGWKKGTHIICLSVPKEKEGLFRAMEVC